MAEQPESQAALDNWRESITEWQKETNTRLDRGNTRLDNLDRGQAHIIRRLDAQDVTITQSAEDGKTVIDKMDTVIQLAENMQAAGRFFNSIYSGATWCVRKTSACAKVLIPIITAALLIWGAWYAYVHGGKPPSVGDASPVPTATASELTP